MNPSNRKRITVSVDEDVLNKFKRMSEVSGMSLARTVGDWLADTQEAAELVTYKIEEFKGVPAVFAQGVMSFIEDNKREAEAVIAKMTSGEYSPSSNTGVNSKDDRGGN